MPKRERGSEGKRTLKVAMVIGHQIGASGSDTKFS